MGSHRPNTRAVRRMRHIVAHRVCDSGNVPIERYLAARGILAKRTPLPKPRRPMRIGPVKITGRFIPQLRVQIRFPRRKH